jgi:hypothetical protein
MSIMVYMYAGGLLWHPYMLSGIFWNYMVHSYMYAYYGCACFYIRWPKRLAQQVTNLQITQMFANLALCICSICTCGTGNHPSLWPSLAMYGVYAALFIDMYRNKYTRSRAPSSAAAAPPKGTAATYTTSNNASFPSSSKSSGSNNLQPASNDVAAVRDQSQASWKHVMTIAGVQYDVTGWIKKHPGGSVIKEYVGKDGTQAFQEFHR